MMNRGFTYGYDMMGGWGWYGGLLMLLFGMLVIGGLVVLIVWAVRASGQHTPGNGSVPPPRADGHHEAVAIAKRRLASGEITTEQYEEIIRALGG